MEKKLKHFLVVALSMLLFISGCSDDDTTREYSVLVNATYAIPAAEQATTTGTVPVDANNYQLGDQITLLGNIGNLTRTTGATFEGWMVPGSSTVYHAGDVVTIPRTLPSSTYTITVKWPQRVTYMANSGTGAVPVDPTWYVTAATVTVAGPNTLSRAGYTFNGWNTAANGSGTARAAGSTFAMPLTAVSLFAQWTANQNTLTYNGNGNTGGTVPVDNNTYATGSTVDAADNTGNLTRTGFSFLGWNTTASGNGTNVAAGGTFTMPTAANTTLYAKWGALYTVTYNGNGNTGGTAPVDSNEYLNGASVTVAAPGTLTRTGFRFNGWNTAADGSGSTVGAGSSFAMGFANVTLYAQWVLN